MPFAAPDRRVGYRFQARGELPVVGSLVAAEEEQLVAQDGPANGAAHLVEDRFRLALASRKEERFRFSRVAVVVFEQRAVQFVGPALDRHVDRGAAGRSGFGVE